MRITAVKAMELRDSAGQSLVRVETDAGLFGIGEAGAAGPAARANLQWLEPVLIGTDPLHIDRLYQQMMGLQHTYQAHVPTVSGVDIALWDLAGKILDRPVCDLLTGRYRDRVEIYYGGAPSAMTDRAVVDDWVAELRSHPHGYRTAKVGFTGLLDSTRLSRPFVGGAPSQTLKVSDMRVVQAGFETLRDVMGWDLDFIVHCHNEFDVPTAIGLCQAVEEARPIWIEDPLQVWFNDGYKALRSASRVPICTGEKIEGYRDFLPFIVEGGIDVLHPDLCWCGGISGGRKIAELADHYGLPVALHNCGSLVHNMANVHFGASVRNFSMSETRIYARPYIAAMGGLDGFDVVDGMLAVPAGPGLGFNLVPEILRAELKEGEPFWD
ncbi:MAG TPA: mandelate racemase/muconate lactonizing enzyme family protein [Candidatus Latescibacteria bacterium]|jgi:L-alanine-DL-glutamate epimerase-like enolase superfamily enzyme|nr:mandelate racemase/muconate lactonizing enzyme family protein [Candidatus Latescibacterota bacterium]